MSITLLCTNAYETPLELLEYFKSYKRIALKKDANIKWDASWQKREDASECKAAFYN